MSYRYEDFRPTVFTEEGQLRFLRVRDAAKRLCKQAGAVRMEKLLIGGGDSWQMMSCVDRLVELGELREITNGDVAGQDRVFVEV